VKILKLKIIILFQIIFATPVFAQYNFDAFFSNAKIDIDKNNYFEAITKLNKCLIVEPNNCEVYFYRALCKYSLLDNFGAEQDFTMALSNFSSILYDAYHYRSLSRYRLGRYSDAIDDINKVIEKGPNIPSLYVERAFIFLADNNFNAAINDCKKALNLKSLGEGGYLCKAQAEDAISDYQNAISDYDEVIKINPKNVDAIALRGMTKDKMGNIKGAINDYNLAIKIDSTSTLAYYNRAEAEIKLNDSTKAMDDYNTVLQYEPRNSYAYFGRAVLFANRKEYKMAISDFNKVILLNPNNIEALFNRAKLKQVIEDLKGAISDYDKVTFLYPYFMEAYYYRSQAKYILKDFAGAEKDMETGKLMSDIFHNKDSMQFNKDSLLLNKLTHLSADFHTTSDIKPDNADNNFLPIFYITEKDSNNYKAKNFSLLLEDFNWKNGQNLCLKNKGSFNNDSTLLHSLLQINNNNSKQALLVSAIYKSNMQLLNEAKEIFDKIISDDSLNTIAIFARGINTCREIELQNNNTDDNYYIITNSKQEKLKQERSEKCKSALADFTKTLKLKPDFYFALYNRAFVKCLLSDFYGANFDYDQAIKQNHNFADAYFNNGFLLYYLNLKQPACENFSKAGELGLSEAFSIIKKNCNGN
jgi:tetratricopeptide (TPR) repeat protein